MSPFKRSGYWQHVRPIGMIADFREVFRQAGKNRWKITIAAMAITATLFWVLTKDSWRIPPAKPEITYINSFPLDRTPEETKAFIDKNQKLKDKVEAREREIAEESKAIYRQIGRMSGMDVEKIEREAREAEAAEAARKQQAPVAPR